MEGYHVISSKKLTLCDIKGEEDQKVNTLEFRSPVPDEVIERACSPLIFEVDELFIDDGYDCANNNNEEISCEDNSLGVLGHMTNNDSNASDQQNPPNYSYLGCETAVFDQSNSMQFDADESTEIHMCRETDDADESSEMHMCSENDDASENGGKAPSHTYFEQYASYICPQCGIDCGPFDKWKLHTVNEHGFGLIEAANVQSIVKKNGEPCHKCRDCPKTFKLTQGFSALILHRISHLPFKYYVVCRICSAKYRSKVTLKHHLQQKHKDLNVNTMPKFQDSALEHIRLFCLVCKEEQSNISEWRAHMKKQHDYYKKAQSKFKPEGNNIYICNVCKNKVRGSTWHLVEHIQTHEDFKPFLCTYCNYSHSQLKLALSHVRTNHLHTATKVLWRCMLCKASFITRRRRWQHYFLEHNVGYQKCKVCKKKFNSSSTLLSHINLTNHHTVNLKT